MSNVAGVAPNSIPSTPCCEQIQEALGRCWIWITQGCHWCLDQLMQGIDVVAFGFFRVIGCFAPQWALRLEVGYGYFSAWYARYSASVVGEVSHATIADLTAVNQGLHGHVVQQARDLTALQVTHSRICSENDRLQAERDADIAARVRMEIQAQLAQQKAELSHTRSAELIAQNVRTLKQLQETIAARAPILAENRVLTDLVGELQKQNEWLLLSTQHAIGERDLAYQSMRLWQGIRRPSGTQTTAMKPLSQLVK